jgi:hypothetical protein
VSYSDRVFAVAAALSLSSAVVAGANERIAGLLLFAASTALVAAAWTRRTRSAPEALTRVLPIAMVAMAAFWIGIGLVLVL